MPLYYFILKNGEEVVPDREGLECADLAAAHAHASAVARELMRNRELRSRPWRLEVRDEDLQPCFEILFADVDDTMAHLPAEYRESIARTSRLTASLHDAVNTVRATLSGVQETLARADELIGMVLPGGGGRTARPGIGA